MVETCDASTLTDVCVDDHLPEIELISLITGDLPQYKLRVSTVTNFTNYNHQDFGIAPPDPEPPQLKLTNDQIEQVFKYFILCGDRVSQMTRVYDDIEAITQLLEEKERDLELAARIGQTLLEQNKHLSVKCEQLEVELHAYIEETKQLRYDLTQKEQLLHLLTSDDLSQSREQSPVVDAGQSKYVEIVQRKLSNLEDENNSLKIELSNLQSETERLELHEKRLTKDCIVQLNEAQQRIKELQVDLDKKNVELIRLQEQSSSAMRQLAAGQHKTKELTIENLDMKEGLKTANEIQQELTTELFELKEKYRECRDMLDATKQEVDHLKIKASPRGNTRYFSMPYVVPPHGSIAAELESLHDPERDVNKRLNGKVIETAQYVRKLSSRPPSLHSSISSTSSKQSTKNLLAATPIPGSARQKTTGKDSVDGSKRSALSRSGQPNFYDEIEKYRETFGKPGIPGSRDLDKALHRLSLRRQNEQSERDFAENQAAAEKKTESRAKYTESDDDMDWSDSHTVRSPSPESELSGYGSASSFSFRMPEKLQIVKPIEGSATLHHWQRLATPNMAGIFEARDGVHKHEQSLNGISDTTSYSLLDHEEDVVPANYKYNDTCSTNTVTDARILHPTTTHYIPSPDFNRPQTHSTQASSHRYGIVSRLALGSRAYVPDLAALDSLTHSTPSQGTNTRATAVSHTSIISSSILSSVKSQSGLASFSSISQSSSASQSNKKPGLLSGIYQYFGSDPATTTTTVNGLNVLMTPSVNSSGSSNQGVHSRWSHPWT